MFAVFRALLFLLPAERAHRLAFGLLRFVHGLPGGAWFLRRWFRHVDRRLVTHAMGLTFPSPVGLAAGFDKDGEGYAALADLGFGFVEVGTVTREAQPGNPPPRLFRLPKDRALLNRLGFNNRGAEAMVEHLQGRRTVPLGVNIGKTKRVADEEAVLDYVATAERVAPYADYVVVNVSSPNTPGLRALQETTRLEPILRGVRAALDGFSSGRRVPLLVEIAPDLADEDVDRVADLALQLQLDGIVATNTTLSREGLVTEAREVERLGAGGLSGRPVAGRSLHVLRRLRRRVGDRLTLVSVGGVFSSGDAWERIVAGATLVQVYTGFVYEGPGFPGRLAAGLALAAERQGYPSVQAAVGAREG